MVSEMITSSVPAILLTLGLGTLATHLETAYPSRPDICWKTSGVALKLIRLQHGDPFGLSSDLKRTFIIEPNVEMCFPADRYPK